MRRSLVVAGLIAGALTALALAASPAIAGAWPGGGPGNFGGGMMGGNGDMMGGSQGQGGRGMMGGGLDDYGRGMMGGSQNQGGRGMMSGGLAGLPSGTLTTAQREHLVSMADEEKLAHDVYVALGTTYPDLWQFAHIQRSESMHQAAIRGLLDRYGIADPTASLPDGTFATARMQSLYAELIAGATTPQKALAAGIAVETTDIADLTTGLQGLSAPDVQFVYTHLRTASEHHLAAFGG